jgi:hypothetical protein
MAKRVVKAWGVWFEEHGAPIRAYRIKGLALVTARAKGGIVRPCEIRWDDGKPTRRKRGK